ncbi:MAG: hypothetical protein KGS61_17745 [Verrucomicrobia bacterium]|nr:hypothetical protein [Verrucomicrobiota bacterium]
MLAYDAGDRLYTLTSPAGTFTNTYLHAGMPIANLGLPNTAVNQFDNVARMTNTALVNSSGRTLDLQGYVCDSTGQRTEEAWLNGTNVNYTYDDENELIQVTAVEGVGTVAALTLLTEVGPDLSRFPTEEHSRPAGTSAALSRMRRGWHLRRRRLASVLAGAPPEPSAVYEV